MVFTVENKIFALTNENVFDISPILISKIKDLGFNYYETKLFALTVNNHGNIFGKFECYDKHPYKRKINFNS